MRIRISAVVLAVAFGAGGGLAAAQAPESVPTFAKDVAPILYENCVTCHRPNNIAPMTLIEYAEVRPWARSVKDLVVSREMPPWPADPENSMKFRNERYLEQHEIDTIAAWVDAGRPAGQPRRPARAARLPAGLDLRGRRARLRLRSARGVHGGGRGRRGLHRLLLGDAVGRGPLRRGPRDAAQRLPRRPPLGRLHRRPPVGHPGHRRRAARPRGQLAAAGAAAEAAPDGDRGRGRVGRPGRAAGLQRGQPAGVEQAPLLRARPRRRAPPPRHRQAARSRQVGSLDHATTTPSGSRPRSAASSASGSTPGP